MSLYTKSSLFGSVFRQNSLCFQSLEKQELKRQYTQKWTVSHHLLQTCMNVFVLEDILKNEGNSSIFSYYWSQWCPKTAWLQQNIFLCVQNKHIHTGLSKWWLTVHFCVHCLFKSDGIHCGFVNSEDIKTRCCVMCWMWVSVVHSSALSGSFTIRRSIRASIRSITSGRLLSEWWRCTLIRWSMWWDPSTRQSTVDNFSHYLSNLIFQKHLATNLAILKFIWQLLISGSNDKKEHFPSKLHKKRKPKMPRSTHITCIKLFAIAQFNNNCTFMHLADTFIQSDLHRIQVTVIYIKLYI